MRNAIRIFCSAIGWAVCAYGLVALLEVVGIRFPNENAAAWMAVIFGIHGGIVAAFGWRYWCALCNDAADLIDEDKPKNAGANDVHDHR